MAGAGYKLFNTGDVLTAAQVNTYLMEQTVMVFADAAARTAALTGVVSEGMISYLKDTNAVEVYNGSAWVASDDPNAIQNTIVDAKGDLITATANDTPARLAVGNDGETLLADSSASTGLRWNPSMSAGKNTLINGAFDIWQRGTSAAIGTNNYIADRWGMNRGSYAAGATVSRQDTNDTTNLPFIQYCARVQRNSGNAATDSVSIWQCLENVNSTPLIGRIVTISFYARKGANYSASSDSLVATLYYGTGTDQNINSMTGITTIASISTSITSTWARYTFSATVPTASKQLAVNFAYSPTGTAGANDYFELTGVQLELGNTATAFSRAGGTLAGELLACQRYYWRTQKAAAYSAHGMGWVLNATDAFFVIPYPATMRIAPTPGWSTLRVIDAFLTAYNVTALVNAQNSASQGYVQVTCAGMTAGRAAVLQNLNSGDGYIAFDAEL